MAQNENQVDVSITLGADISGGVQTEKELERIRSKAKETERTAKNVDGFKKLRQGAEDVRLCHIIYFERKRLTAHAIRDRFSMWLTTARSAPTPQLRNGQLAFVCWVETQVDRKTITA